ncbi:hypothetical protein EV146_114148 [Mesobacillus foraminis]|uniref:Uncharacterized protein n=1 Tax=Mesobacillus foraminis TaxID=279826 RepID=A0A4R2B225_9BACI|nr:hypothetical protein EV146_114148 [Mesobacillus foraminis]
MERFLYSFVLLKKRGEGRGHMSVAEKAAPLQVNRMAVYLLVFFFVWSLKELWLIE